MWSRPSSWRFVSTTVTLPKMAGVYVCKSFRRAALPVASREYEKGDWCKWPKQRIDGTRSKETHTAHPPTRQILPKTGGREMRVRESTIEGPIVAGGWRQRFGGVEQILRPSSAVAW